MTSTRTPAATVAEVATAEQRNSLAWLDTYRRAGGPHAPGAFAAGARTVLLAVAFRDSDDERVQELVRALAAVEAAGEDADRFEPGDLVCRVASAALHGYSLPLLGEPRRVLELLAAVERDVPVRTVREAGAEGDAHVVGTVTLTEARTVVQDRGTPWPETLEVPAQTVELVLARPGYRGGDAWLSARFRAVSVRRETGAQFGGVDVVRRADTTPQETTWTASCRSHEGVRSLLDGELFGGTVVLAEGVELVASRYRYAGNDPRSLRLELRVAADVTAPA